jgi:DNA-binding protein H-NS
MPNFKFETLTTSELLDIRDYVDELLKSRAANERREIERTLARIGIGEGGGKRATPGRGRSSLKGVKVAPKYRNPQTGETWAGRGATPRWLQALLRRGRKLKDFAIDKPSGRKSRVAKRPRKNRAAKRPQQKKR